jgi:phage shock protein A
MNRFSVACRAFADGLSSSPSVTDIRESKIADARRSLNHAVEDVRRLEKALTEAKARVAAYETKVEQLNSLPSEAFAILLG